jgi:hypothetical protein
MQRTSGVQNACGGVVRSAATGVSPDPPVLAETMRSARLRDSRHGLPEVDRDLHARAPSNTSQCISTIACPIKRILARFEADVIALG